MEYQKIIQSYEHWLAHREYSPATIQKYTRALTRFFADTGAGKKPTRETVAAWRDSLTAKGYTPSTVNALLAAVNDYQESIDNPAGKAKPLKRQRRIFADPGRELSRAEYFRLLSAARAIGNKRSQLLLETICSTGIRGLGTAIHHGGGCPPPQGVHPLQGQMPRDPVACRALPPPDPLVPEASHPHRAGVSLTRGQAAVPRHSLEAAQSPVRASQRGVEESIPPQSAAPVCPDVLRSRKKYLEAGRPAWPFQYRDDADLYHGIGRRTRAFTE